MVDMEAAAHTSSLCSVPADYGKRVYQGVRVKHTVKDLLAEKRSRQTSSSRFNGNVASTQQSFVPLSGSPAVSSYYGVRRSLMADMDLQSNKQVSSEAYPSSLLAKSFAYELPAIQGYSSLMDSYLIDQYSEHPAASVTSGASSLFSVSSLPSVLPSFPSDPAHFLTRDSWEQAVPDSLSQSDACPDSLQASPAANCLTPHEPGGPPSQYRNPSWSSPLSGSQSYSLHALEDAHYAAGYSPASPYPFSSFMTVPNDLTPKMLHSSSEESADTAPLHDSNSLWPKEDRSPLWGSYECRRTY
ncbi:POU domain class 2-associating factor 2 [Hemicordylus capensis]|uniref:POU domain class 2-associating factor 2 n=1 Tax=Hemicordylus capensis TaxID=884348 RepID=UPI0023033EA8|nr:POU domain class 2-associating factor 2 [Hemicordylus capensis]